MYENETKPQRALLVSLDTGEYDAESSLRELEELTRTAGAEPALTMTQKRPAPDTATCIGSGMVEQAAQICQLEDGVDSHPNSQSGRGLRCAGDRPHHPDP